MPASPESIPVSQAATVQPAAASAVPPLLMGVAVTLPPALPALGRGELAALAAAVFAHALVIVALLDRYDRIGSDGTRLEAIGVEIVTLAEMSAALPKPPDALRRTTTGTLPPHDGAPAEPQQPSPDARAAVSEPRPDAAAPADLVFPDARRRPDPPDPDSTAPVIAPERAPGSAAGPVPELRQTIPEQQPSLDNAIPAEALLPSPQGGAPAPPKPMQRLAAVEADAAVGRRDAYGQAVFDTLRANPPAVVPGASGRVTIEFTIGRDGAPTAVRVLVSSGDARMDRAAIAAVRGARFPRPPIAVGK
jgi:TonB family protein